MWKQELKPAVLLFLIITVLTGALYPFAITQIASLFFPNQSGGSLIEREGQVLGSEQIGQPFDDPKYFWGRPSATSPFGYNAAASSGSNLGPTNEALKKAVADRVAALKSADPENTVPVPVDLVTASGSGLDPDITPASALYQLHRVATARGVGEETIRRLIDEKTEGRPFGVFGEPRINVLDLNLTLDAFIQKRDLP
ncbi:MAG: potassium-transporting ATPase subunit KdpC [Nitrospirae bacterium]|nr:potassium-transporting ATPase subunit KdpC [Candidatus Manganitrophaceae bacterium]